MILVQKKKFNADNKIVSGRQALILSVKWTKLMLKTVMFMMLA